MFAKTLPVSREDPGALVNLKIIMCGWMFNPRYIDRYWPVHSLGYWKFQIFTSDLTEDECWKVKLLVPWLMRNHADLPPNMSFVTHFSKTCLWYWPWFWLLSCLLFPLHIVRLIQGKLLYRFCWKRHIPSNKGHVSYRTWLSKPFGFGVSHGLP